MEMARERRQMPSAASSAQKHTFSRRLCLCLSRFLWGKPNPNL